MHNRIKRMAEAIDDWLRPDSPALNSATQQTVEEGLFSLTDVRHQLLALRNVLSAEILAGWSEKNRLRPGELGHRKTLCLHAGNLPLAGFQDLVACCLAGTRYYGKVSRNDPWLLPSFIETLQAHQLMNESVWSTHIDAFSGCEADCVLFSGSARSVGEVKEALAKHKLAKKKASYLIRSAHFSLAYIDNTDPYTMEYLAEAVLRYGGKGCRSVAVVIAPFELNAIKCEFTDYIESFWQINPPHEKPPPSLHHRFAYNKAVGHPQVWLDDFLIEQTEMTPEHDFVLHWINGDESRVPAYLQNYGQGLQTVYRPHSGIMIEGLGREPELLSTAQKPPVDWKPDGIDTVEWLLSQ